MSRFVLATAAGVVASWCAAPYRTGHDVECYRSIENALHFRNKQRPGQVFSQRYEPYTLGDIIPITSDVALFRFLLQQEDDEFNLKPCSTLQACYKYGAQPSEQCHRFYTPISANRTKGYFDLIVKRKEGGMMTQHMFGMHKGDKLLFRSVAFKIQYRPNRWDHVCMIAGGTGFTPMLQIIRHSLMEQNWDDKKEDKTKLYFLFCNRTERHVLLKGVFDDLAKRYTNRFKVAYTVDHAVDKEKWLSQPNHYTGFVTKDMLRQIIPPPETKKKIIMLCGPDGLLAHVAGTPMGTMAAMSGGLHVQPTATDINNLVSLGGLLNEMGYSNEEVYRF